MRKSAEAHPLMKKYGVDAFPANLAELNEWGLESAADCDLCAYRKAASEVLGSGC